MQNLLLIVACMAIGQLLRRFNCFPDNAAHSLNLYVIYVSLPALVLLQIPRLDFSWQALIPALAAWVLLGVSAGATFIIAKMLNWPKAVEGCLMLVVPLGNTSFLGLPLLEATLGNQSLPIGLLYDQFGSFIALSTYGLWVLSYYSGEKTSSKQAFVKVISFPPFISVVTALALLPFQYPNWLLPLLQRLGDTLVPVVIVAVGLQWQLKLDKGHTTAIGYALCIKLVVMPMLALIAFLALGKLNLTAKTTILQAGMPAMITAGALAASHNLAPRMASAIVGYGVLLSLISVPLWHLIITFLS